MPTAEMEMLDVLSTLDENDEPVLGNCSLSLGDVTLEFKNGRSKVPAEHAAEVLRHPAVIVPGYTGPAAPPVPKVAAQLPDGVQKHRESTPENIEAAKAYLVAQGIDVPEPETGQPPITAEQAQMLMDRITELERMVAEGAIRTNDEGDAQGQTRGVAPTVETQDEAVDLPPAGIEPLTASGEPRCWARKGDGSQCTNPSVEGHACNLRAHIESMK